MKLIDNVKCNKGESRIAFFNKVVAIAAKLKINPNWLMVIMLNESGLNAQAVNKQKGDTSDAFTRAKFRATGLIQFMPETARLLGISTQALFNMTNLQQLDYVYAFFKPYAGKIRSYFDLYMITFFPAALGKNDDYVIQSPKIAASTIARQNPSFDLNKDGKITVGEAKKTMLKAIPETLLDEVLSVAEKKSLN